MKIYTHATDVFHGSNSQPLLSGAQVKNLEQLYCHSNHIPSYELMQRAGEAAWLLLKSTYPKARRLLILVGPGNNGGDGFEVALHALKAGYQVRLISVVANLATQVKSDAAIAFKKLMDFTGDLIDLSYDIHDISKQLIQGDLIVDAVLGTGIEPPARDNIIKLVDQVNASPLPVLSIDVPSGLNAETGIEIGKAIKANTTLTFIRVKPGLVTAGGSEHCGQLYLANLGTFDTEDTLSESLNSPTSDATTIYPLLTQLDFISPWFKARNNNTHKGNFGRTLIIGGNLGMGGAAILAARAAYRSGSGAVILITRPEHVSAALNATPETMVIGTDDSGNHLAETAINSATSIVIGPGLGQDDWATFWLQKALACKIPTIIDADGLRLAKKIQCNLTGTIITPHPGEAGILLEKEAHEVQQNRYQISQHLQQLTGAVVILKGAGSIIHTGKNIHVCPFGNPAMATAGMGDVLAGVIGALLAQGLSIEQAAIAGTLIHSYAGDLATKNLPVGLIASDVIDQLRLVVSTLPINKTKKQNP